MASLLFSRSLVSRSSTSASANVGSVTNFMAVGGGSKLPTNYLFSNGIRSGMVNSIRPYSTNDIQKMRNIGISAHIDSGKTTLTERILYYTGRIKEMHDVRGKDGVGAKMDSMDLEREKGITIQSAATYAKWGDQHINIIDTPGHVDFTIEVERALRVLDGAVLVMCGVSGVQSQTITVDRQMRRYNVPRVTFINKLDRVGADPWKVIDQLRSKLSLNAAAVQIPIGGEINLEGVCDLLTEKAYIFGEKGSKVQETEVPSSLVELLREKKIELIERVANVDDKLGEWIIENDFPANMPDEQTLGDAIRRCTVNRTFVPVFMGSAFKNIGVQKLLDGVVRFLPNPSEKKSIALDLTNNEAEVELSADPKKPFVGLAFKLEEGRFGQLTYMRVYQGTLKRGDMIKNVNLNKVIKVPRLVRMHANEMEEVQEVGAGEICAMFGVDCYSGNTFTQQQLNYTMTSMHVPEPVMSLSIAPKGKDGQTNFTKALNKFQKEDPTFRVQTDQESGQIVISGMGELHLDIYVERMRREYNVETVVGKPLVAYRETIQSRGDYNYTHKKQSGGQGQYAKMIGYIEPTGPEGPDLEFVNDVIGTAITPNFIEAIKKGFNEAVHNGPLIGHPISGVRFVVNDGATHSVDSSELAFRICAVNAFKEGFKVADPMILEPIMKVEILTPIEFQGTVIGGINRRKGAIFNTGAQGENITIECEVPLNNMFGYSTELRSSTQGKGEFTMEYSKHSPVTREQFDQLIEEYQKKRAEEKK
ncbi:mitochondrial translation elongation factor G [Heterostelium album PN500]|uniref:Elongation factor G, mitochondrial n=1 Tax=Heterostelium pallidum (strain ATCC 26659 / Pp 5 / PN500) TaxID=670386 RepID=D3BMN4_HETP5|nr:mitochondrial translation elongation factor G [Heterostelium album PN500]EFA77246.1 mitochondrial translation elongation factor G [Heterostelium album PN500]|eukprot:XP_020429375.1 mitochondrial translation elongation factor G [Heterostelium album PN500]